MLFKERFRGTKALREQALRFLEKGVYTNAPKNTIAYREYWQEQREYCLNGFEAGGIKITGRNYFYLNFCPILMLENNSLRKKESLPLFYDYDKWYFDKVDEAILSRKGIVLLKGRRKGFSYKGASLLAYEYTFVKNSVSFVGAYLEEYATNTFNFCVNMLDFLIEETAFGKKRIIDKSGHKKAGYKLKNGSVKGTGNEIKSLTFKGNPSKSLGKSANLFIFEEVGKWENLLESYLLTEPLFKEGNRLIGLPILQGTAGDLSEGITPFAEFFYNPDKYNLLALDNIWDTEDKAKGKKIGLFFPSYYGHRGIYGENEYNTKKEFFNQPMVDEEGNSNIEVAKQDILDKRVMLGGAGSEKAKYLFITENPIVPSEAFMIGGYSLFNVERIHQQIVKVRSYKNYTPQKGRLIWGEKNGIINKNEVVWIPDDEGSILIWEHPVELKANQKSPYISGIDPIDLNIQIKRKYHSDGAMFVFKQLANPLDINYDIKTWHEQKQKLHHAIVCEYVDRPNNVEEFYENTLKINTYYNCYPKQCMVENNKKNIIDYYIKEKKAHLYLHGSPEILEGKFDYNPSVKIGVTVSAETKQVLLEYAISFLDKYTEHIFSEKLLEELSTYNDFGNFDRVSALLMVVLMFEEVEYYTKRKTVRKEFASLPMYQFVNGTIKRI